MYAGKRSDNARMLTVEQGSEYTGLGRTNFRIWAEKIGAKRTFGPRLVRYDREVIDKAFSEMTE